MKILEAANIGVPFISTSIGSVGLNFENGKNCIIANTKKEFIEAIMTTQRNRDLLQSLANAAYQHVTADFSDEKFVESRMKAYLSLLSVVPPRVCRSLSHRDTTARSRCIALKVTYNSMLAL